MTKYFKITLAILFFKITSIATGAVINPGIPDKPTRETGTLAGIIVDSETGEKIAWTVLLIDELHFWQTQNKSSFQLPDIPVGEYILKTYRVGYAEARIPVQIASNETTFLRIELQSVPLAIEGVTVYGDTYWDKSELERPEISLSGKNLRQNLGRTLAETIDYEPGIAQRTMGPAPARPVLRGLDGDRLLILEDGERTGDLSHTSSDHAVAIEPISSERVEIIRGPEALTHGSNTIGGVVNVVRGYIPVALPAAFTGSTSLQGESVNSGYAGSFNATIPVNKFAVRFDGSYRDAGDIGTPVGTLANTEIRTGNTTVGVGYIRDWGYIGAAGSFYDTEYGIPPDPEGGHPSGVNINMDRRHLESRLVLNPSSSWVDHFSIRHNYTRYFHEEIEANGTIGSEFGVVTHHLSSHLSFSQKPDGLFRNARIGFWGESRDYTSGGLTFTPASQELTGAFYGYQELVRGRFSANLSLRFDTRTVTPDQDKQSDTVGRIRQRNFLGFSGGIASYYAFGKGFRAGLTLIRTFRAPGIEELFSEGPHLAAYSYEIGNADLDDERGLGLEASLSYEHRTGNFRLAAFRNSFDNYIFPRNTGERSLRRYDLFVYQYSGEDALMTGLEGSFIWKFSRRLAVSGTLSYVRGELVDLQQPIPRIPPLMGKIGLNYGIGQLTFGALLRAATEQNRAGAFEQPTDGYAIIDFSAQYNVSTGSFLHTFSLTLTNIGDTVYRSHLNRIKEVMPEPGRNLKILYRLFF